VTNSLFESCTIGAGHALSVTNGFLSVQQSTFIQNRAAVSFNGNTFTAQGSTSSGAGFSPAPTDTSTAVAAMQVVAQSITIVQNSVTGHAYTAGIRVQGGSGSMRLDSNLVSTNNVGIRLGSLSNFNATNNNIFDNAPAGVVNEVATAITMPSTWWGDGRGPRRLADATATGDSLSGNVTAASWNAAPLANGTAAADEHKVRGDAQTGVRGTALAKAFTVRVVDAAGRAVSGVSVRFKVISGGGSFGGAGQINITTNASGLAEATLTLGGNPGTNTATVTLGGLTVTFTATGT